jgi:hypothetical protein
MYGVLRNSTNTGLDSELAYVFATPLVIRSNQPALISDTMSLKRKVNSQNVQRWEIETDIVPSNDNDASSFLIHSVKNGFTEVFNIRMPQVYSKNKINQELALSLSDTKLIGSNTINISGLSNVDLTGQFITFAGDTKVYLITSKGTNGANIEIMPRLLKSFASQTSITYGDKTILKARYDSDVQLGVTYIDGILASPGTIRFIEAL